MKTKNRKIYSILSLFLIGILTFSFLFFSYKNHLFDFFKTGQKLYITMFISIGILLIIVGSVLAVKTFKQFRTEKEILKTKHSDLGVYNKVRNPVYSAVFLISSGLLLLTSNFVSIGIIGVNWLILTILIVFTKESRRKDRSNEE